MANHLKHPFVAHHRARLVEPARTAPAAGFLLVMSAAVALWPAMAPSHASDPSDHAAAPKGELNSPSPSPRPLAKDPRPLAERSPHTTFCRYPQREARPAEPDDAVIRLIALNEIEPNNTMETAQPLPLGTGAGQDVDLNVAAQISTGSDVDYFSFMAQKGDVLGVAVVGSGSMDPVLHLIRGSDGQTLIINDDFEFHTFIYPPSAPWPGGNQFTDSAMTFTAAQTGQYILKIEPHDSLSTGAYQLRIRSRKPNLRGLESPGQQIVFLDFDGATINVCELFGCFPPLNPPFRTLSPLSTFIPNWGLNANQESAVIDAIIATVQENFDSLRLASLNGDLRGGDPPGSFDVTLLNSRDHMDPFGQPNVSRVIIGGTQEQLTISTIGLAEHIDPGNFVAEDTSVVLLDAMSEPSGGNPICCSINDIPRAPGFTMVQAIGRIVGNIVTHEVGHNIGCWHTTTLNSQSNIMDEGGNLLAFAGAGPDGFVGTGDDVDVDFVGDTFSTFEYFSGFNQSDVVAAFALSTGALPAVPPELLTITPLADAEMAQLGQVSLTFTEPVRNVTAANLRVNGVAASSVSGIGGGPYLFQGFTAPGDGMVTVEVAAGQITDRVGNPFAGGAWQYVVKDCNANLVFDPDEVDDGTASDCNLNGVLDICEPDMVRSRIVPDATIVAGQTIQLGDWLPITGGEPPLTYQWHLRGNPAGELADGPDPSYGPLSAGTYVVKVTATDNQGCSATGYITVLVEAASDGDVGSGGDAPGGQNPPGSFDDIISSACGSGAACGGTGGGLVLMLTVIGTTLGARRLARRRR
jgi:hypothetical protein